MSDNATAVLLIGTYIAAIVVAIAWEIVLPVVGLLYLCGFMK